MIRRVLCGVWFLVIIFVNQSFAQQKKDVQKLFEEAETAHDNGQYQTSLDLLNECIKLSPGFLQAYYIRGAAKEQLNDPAGALTDYSIYLETNDADNEARLARGLLHFRQGHYDLARKDFEKMITFPSGPTNTIFYRQSSYASGTDQIMTVQSGGKAYLLNFLGLCDTKLKEFPKAIANFDSAIVLDPRNADYFVNRGIAKEGLGDSTARADYQKALSIDPSHGIAQHNLSVLQSRKGDKSAAEDILNDMIDSDSTMLYAYRQRAYQRLDAGYFKGALEDYNEALKIDQSDPELFMARGIAREKLKDLEGAFSDYTKAIDLKENMEKAWLNRGNVLAKLNRLQDAIEDYTVAITYQAEFAAAFYNRGLAKYRLKLLTEACDDIRIAEQMGFKVDDKTRAKICNTKN
jgi:tetratricopeptide (TPR) repeat protein